MKQLKRLPLFVLLLATLASCTLFRNVSNIASAPYQKLKIAQQEPLQKHNETVAVNIPPEKTTKSNINLPPPESAANKPIAATRHKHKIINILTKPFAPGFKFIAMGREHICIAHSNVKNAQLTVRHSLKSLLTGFLLIIAGAILIIIGSVLANEGNESAFIILLVIGYIIATVGFFTFLVSIFLLIIALIKRAIVGYD